MKPIRVLEIISGFAVEGPLGGIERFGIELAQAFDRSQIEPIVCGMWAYGTAYEYEWVSRLQQLGIDAFIAADWQESAPYKSFARVYKNLASYVDQADIIHSHCQFGDVLALLYRRRLQAKALVRTVHNEKEWGKRPLRRFMLTNLLYPLTFDLELGVAQQVVDNLNERPVARWQGKTAVKSYNALNQERFAAKNIDMMKKKTELGLAPSARIVGTVGRLSTQKGYRYLLQAAAQLIDEFSDVSFLIVGDGELRDDLIAQTHHLGLENRVLFTGPRPDVEELLPIMELFVNSSLWEGLPTVIMESMAARVPVVATAVGGNAELIEDNVTGWLVPAGDPGRLANAIRAALTAEKTERLLIGERAYQKVIRHFSIDAVARQHEKIYQKLLADN